MYKVDRKPLSANEAWQGRRFKSPAYKRYEKDLLILLPTVELPEPPYSVVYEFGVSNRGFDGDNAIKAFQDVLSTHLKKQNAKFNDNQIYHWEVIKTIVPRGTEYIRFSIGEMKDD